MTDIADDLDRNRAGSLGDLARSYEAFWTDAGIDYSYQDDPRDWHREAPGKTLKDQPPPGPTGDAASEEASGQTINPARPKIPEAHSIGGPRDGYPTTLADFSPWWMADPTLDSGPNADRRPPDGAAHAQVMMLVADPAPDDRTALLSGADGRLLDSMLRAMGITRADTYLASVLPRHTPAPDWSGLSAAGLGAVTRHHLDLAVPERLVVFGRDLLPLLQPQEFDTHTGFGAINAGGRQIPLMASYPLGVLAKRPAYKRIWWQRWLAFSRTS